MRFVIKYGFLLKLLMLLSFNACGLQNISFGEKVEKTEIKTDQLIKRLLESNEKVFYKRSTYATYAYVWIHKFDDITCYEVSCKSIKKRTIVNDFGYIITDQDTISILDTIYPFRLDGDDIGYAFKLEKDDINTVSIPCDIAEFMDIKFSSEYKLAIQLQNDYSQILKVIKSPLLPHDCTVW